MLACHQPEFCAGWLYFHMSNYIIDSIVVMKNQTALCCIQHLMETDAIQGSETAGTYKGAQKVWKLNSLSLQGKEGYYCEKL